MATTNNVVVANFVPSTASNIVNQVWKLTRALKKAGWKYIASGNGTTKDTTGAPESDLWGAGTTSNAGATGSFTIGTPSRGRAQVSGLSGIVSDDKGRFLSITGATNSINNHQHQIEEIVNSTTVMIDARTFAVVGETTPGTATWSVKNPLGDTWPLSTDISSVAAWWCARGPSTLKVPITAAPTNGPTGSTFVRGENIVQATTGFEGEILGYVWDGSSTGYLVVAPRLRGTGSGIYGLDTTYVLTGDLSGAYVAQSGTALEYRHEIVFWKTTNQTQGSIFHGTFEPVGDTLFSSLVGSSGCASNGTVPPGGGGTGNSFPTYGYVSHGTSTSGGHVTWNTANFGITHGNAQIMCADLIEEQDYSADGSWVLAFGHTTNIGGEHCGHAFQRCDDSEDGDLDPYVTFQTGGNATLYTNSRTTAGSAATSGGASQGFSNNGNSGSTPWTSAAYTLFRGWRKRGQTGESFQDFEGGWLMVRQTFTAYPYSPMTNNASDIDKVATALVTTRVREPLWVISCQVNSKMRKGTLRWMHWIGGGNGYDTYDSKKWVQLSPVPMAIVAGPWDGSSQPTVA